MKQRYLVLFCIFFAAAFFTETSAQQVQVLDSANVIYVDNTSDGNTGATGTLMNDPKYREFPPSAPVPNVDGWWSNTGSIWWGGNSRRASRYGSGNNTGAHAHFYCTVYHNDHYLVYHHMWSGNSTTDAYVTFTRFGEGLPVDSFRYNMLANNTPEDRGSWMPLGIVELFPVDSSLTVEIGLDSLGSNTLRVDAVALLRSPAAGPDIEFGARRFTRVVIDQNTLDTLINDSFYKDRAPLAFSPTTFKGGFHSDKSVTIYNLGSQTLTVTGYTSQTNRFTITTPMPFNVAPGAKKDIVVRFKPLGEEMSRDTLGLLSNDAAEPEAALPVIGEGVNYNFIMNASIDGSEPHYNISNGVFQTIGTGWLTSTPSKFLYPIPGGNRHSIVNTGDQSAIATVYRFQLPDTLFGNYYIEYSGPTTSNAATGATVEVVTPFIADTQKVTGFDQNQNGATFWSRIGGNKVFNLNSGGETVVKMTNPGAGLLRNDLLRVRLVPIAPDVSTSLDPNRLLNYGSVSIYDSVRQNEFNFQRNVVIGSNGETPLRIDTMYLSSGTIYEIVNLPSFPLTLPAIDGEYNLLINFLPDLIQQYGDTLWIQSNDPNDSTIFVRLNGQGVGTGITVDDSDPTTFVYPEVLTWTGQPDPNNMDKWYRISGQGGVNQNRLFNYIYFNPPTGVERVEWFPYFPFNPNNPGVNEPDSFDVFVQIPTNSINSSPAAKYRIKHFNGVTDTVISQFNRTLNNGKIPLGRYTFLRGGQDSPGSGTVFGSVELLNDTALVSAVYADSIENVARRDSFLLRADALILEQAGNVVSVEDPTLVPVEYSLSQNFPNPFNPTTQIRFTLPKISNVSLKIYDILGREVATLLQGEQPAGVYTLEWNGRNSANSKVASGIYIYRLVAGKFVQSKKMMMLK